MRTWTARLLPTQFLLAAVVSMSVLTVFGCSSTGSDAGDSGASSSGGPELRLLEYREPHTTYWEIHADGEHVGYLLSYDALPEFSELERHLPSGSHRIQNLGFADLGYVTPTGEVLRHGHGGADTLGGHPLREGLRLFYGEPKNIELIRLRDAVARDGAAEDIS